MKKVLKQQLKLQQRMTETTTEESHGTPYVWAMSGKKNRHYDAGA
ncbi:MAG: hypothetical protein V8S74_02720 [Lachnospirales bacterium]